MLFLPRVTLVVSLLLPALSPAAGQKDAPEYMALVEAYRAGDRASIARVGQLTATQVDKGVKQVLSNDAAAASQGRPRTRVRAAAMLHLECALVLEGQATQDAFDRRVRQEDAAVTLVRALFEPPPGKRPKGPDSDEAFVLAWFRFRAAHDMGRGQYRVAGYDVNMGRLQAGDDPELLLAGGALHELAWRMAVEEGRTVDRFSGDLAQAERLLEAAVAAAPTLAEARVRLGRVQMKAGRPESALRTLAGVTGADTESGFVYLARLFEGDAFDALHDGTRAAQAYAAAIDVMPAAQSARMSLARLLFVAGQRDDAARRVAALATGAGVGDARDPWVLYRLGVAWRAPGYLDVLRAMVQR